MKQDSSRHGIHLSTVYTAVCDAVVAAGFKHIASPAMKHMYAGEFTDAADYKCFIAKANDGYIHLAVARSKLKDTNNNPRVKIACSLKESSVPNGRYTVHFPWDMSLAGFNWLCDTTHGFTKLRGNPNFIPGLNTNAVQVKTKAFFSLFLSRFKRYFPFAG